MRPPKKSETLEIRLPYETKAAFMARCRDGGQTASDALRGFIDGQLEHSPRRGRLRLWQAVAAAVAGLTIGAVAAPSLAQTAPADHAAFARLDLDHDGVLTPAEFERR